MTSHSDGGLLIAGETWQELLTRQSFIELDALRRAEALADPGSLRVLCGPFARIESPWLAPQGITPQSDDGTVIARATIGGRPTVIAAIEQKFSGGGTGEVSGAKISQALLLACNDSRNGTPTAAIILFETGGVRLQEANLGLNAVAEICSAVLDLREYAAVVGVVAGTVGSFGGMSIAAGLCSHLVVTTEARIGLNGPAVIESEAGPEEFDSTDHALIWSIDGGRQRHATGLADTLVPDDSAAIREAVAEAVAAGAPDQSRCRSRRLDVLAARLATMDPLHPPAPSDLRKLWGGIYEIPAQLQTITRPTSSDVAATQAGSRGRTWIHALAGDDDVTALTGSVLRADTATVTYLAVVHDPANPYHRARGGQVGLTESLTLALAVHDVVQSDRLSPTKRAIVAVVDVPSQAYGRLEEMAGLHQAMAATVDAYHAARSAGHPIVALVVGTALSGGFLTHGLQANQILALDDPGVEIHAMHKAAAAKITLRTEEQLDELAKTIAPMSYSVEDWATLGFCDGLLKVENPEAPTAADIAYVDHAIIEAIERARSGPWDLSNRLDSPGAIKLRQASRHVRDALSREWHTGD